MKKAPSNLIVGLDIGTSKVVALAATVDANGEAVVVSLSQEESRGIQRGRVVDVEATTETVRTVLAKAEAEAGQAINAVYTGIAGDHIKSSNSTGTVPIREKEVTPEDIERVIESAKAVMIPNDQQLLSVEAQEFIIDGQGGIRRPLGMSGVRLEVKVHLATCSRAAAENISKCIKRAGYDLGRLIMQPLASADACLFPDERELGVALIDIGGGTTDIAIFSGGALRAVSSIAIAGDHVNNDIAMTLRTPRLGAEALKHQFGIALASLVEDTETVEVPGVGDRPSNTMSRQTLAKVIELRLEELFKIAEGELRRAGFDSIRLPSGIVLTGGSSALPKIRELAEEVFHVPVRVGLPKYSGHLQDLIAHPRYATVVGLLRSAQSDFSRQQASRVGQAPGGRLLVGFSSWIKRNF